MSRRLRHTATMLACLLGPLCIGAHYAHAQELKPPEDVPVEPPTNVEEVAPLPGPAPLAAVAPALESEPRPAAPASSQSSAALRASVSSGASYNLLFASLPLVVGQAVGSIGATLGRRGAFATGSVFFVVACARGETEEGRRVVQVEALAASEAILGRFRFGGGIGYRRLELRRATSARSPAGGGPGIAIFASYDVLRVAAFALYLQLQVDAFSVGGAGLLGGAPTAGVRF